MKRSRSYLIFHSRELLFNALINPIFEYWCSVWVNTTATRLTRILMVQKHSCGRLILEGGFLDKSVQIFARLQWLLIDDLRLRKLFMMFQIVNSRNKLRPDYFRGYLNYVCNRHQYYTRSQQIRCIESAQIDTNSVQTLAFELFM